MSLRKPRGNIHIFIPIVNAKAGKRYSSFVRILIFSNSRPGRCAYRSNNIYITVHSVHNLTTNLHRNIATGRFLCAVAVEYQCRMDSIKLTGLYLVWLTPTASTGQTEPLRMVSGTKVRLVA